MAQVLIVFASDYGNTEKMANAVADGVNSVDNVSAVLKKAEEATADDMTASDGVIFGSPVHMGSVDWRVKKFIDTVCSGLWMQDSMNGRVAGVFTSGGGFGGAGGGTEVAMLSILNTIAELGMLIVPLPKNTENYTKGGLHWGPYGRSADQNMEHVGVSDEALLVAKKHGANIARTVVAINGRTLFAA
jgi:NAD(P)H dehydrogenase (quinone)